MSWPLFTSMLYFTKKNDPARVIWTYDMNDVFSVIVMTLFLIKPAKMLKSAPEEKTVLKAGSRDGEEKPMDILNVSLVV
jgi:hypothetical protein